MVSAWASANGLVLGQVATDAKSNEITAIPELLRLLDLKGCIVTIDAAGTQTAIAEQIVAGGGGACLWCQGEQKRPGGERARGFLGGARHWFFRQRAVSRAHD